MRATVSKKLTVSTLKHTTIIYLNAKKQIWLLCARLLPSNGCYGDFSLNFIGKIDNFSRFYVFVEEKNTLY